MDKPKLNCNKPVVGLKCKIAKDNMLNVFLEAYRSTYSDDIELISMPKQYWEVFMPRVDFIENDLISEIERRLSDRDILEGRGIKVLSTEKALKKKS